MHPTNCFNAASMSLASPQGRKPDDKNDRAKGIETQADLTGVKKSDIPASESALATARVISDISSVSYPEGVSGPNPALNQNAKDGKFRYDLDFLMQFMSLCKERPPSLPPLDMLGLEPLDTSSLNLSRGCSGPHRTSSSATAPTHKASISPGFSPSALGKGFVGSFNQTGNFVTPGGSKLNCEYPLAASNHTVFATNMPSGARPIGLTKTASSSPGRDRTRSSAKEKGKEAYQRQHNSSRVGSRRGCDLGGNLPTGPDGWAVAGSNPARQPTKAGDLSNFGKIKKDQPLSFGPSSASTNKKPDSKISRTALSTNTFSMLSSQNAENGGAAAKSVEPQRKRVVLQPKPVDSTGPAETSASVAQSENSGEKDMSEESALKKASEGTKEFFDLRNIEEDAYFTDLPPKFRSKLVENLVGHVVEAKEDDALLLADFFARAVTRGLCSPEAFEEGFIAIAEDILYDAPNALDFFVIALKGACLDENRRSNIVSKLSERLNNQSGSRPAGGIGAVDSTLTASSGPGRKRARTKRKKSNKVTHAVPAPVGLASQHSANFELVAPLQATENRKASQADANSPDGRSLSQVVAQRQQRAGLESDFE